MQHTVARKTLTRFSCYTTISHVAASQAAAKKGRTLLAAQGEQEWQPVLAVKRTQAAYPQRKLGAPQGARAAGCCVCRITQCCLLKLP